MSAASIVRHQCGRLIFYGQRCVCESLEPFDCDCTSSGNREHEGAHCRSMRRAAWARAIEAAKRIARNP